MWSRNIALILAVGFAGAGLAGFVPALVSPPADAEPLVVNSFQGDLFGLFPINLLHNLVHLAFALWGFFAYFSSVAASRSYLRSTAVIYIVFAVAGLIPGLNTMFGLVPLHSHDIWLHLVLGGLAAYGGYFVRERDTAADVYRTHV